MLMLLCIVTRNTHENKDPKFFERQIPGAPRSLRLRSAEITKNRSQ